MPEAATVRVEHQRGVTTLTLDSPHNRNALSSGLLHQLADGLEAAAHGGARLVVLTATGTTFCSGADLQERLARGAQDARGARGARGAQERGNAGGAGLLPELLTAIRRARCPVLARINGHVRAGGMGLVAACDLAVAPAGATFAFSEVRVGVVPAVIAVPAVLQVAPRHLARAMLTGSVFDAGVACDSGLLTAVVRDDQELDGWVEEVAEALRAAAPGAVARTKQLLDKVRRQPWGVAMSEARAVSEAAFVSEEGAEGMRAFLEKRLPAWAVPQTHDHGRQG